MSNYNKSPFPWFGGKSSVIDTVWARLGKPKQYIEPFFGSGAMLIGSPQRAALEVVNDGNGFLANFWRCVKHQPGQVAVWADYPVSHVDLGARHRWLMVQRERIGAELQDADWPGDAKVAGWWLWGQCAWIGSGWCDWWKEGQIPHAGNAGMGVQALGQIPHAGDAGRGGLLTTCGQTTYEWMFTLAARFERVRVVHGDWHRCLNSHYGGDDTAVFLDPPYKAFEGLYGGAKVAAEVEDWARENSGLRIAICGHVGDYNLPGWDAVGWDRGSPTYGSTKTGDQESIWFSPACLPVESESLFSEANP